VVGFWGLGWLGIFFYDYLNDSTILNVLLEPEQENEKLEAIAQLIHLIKSHSIIKCVKIAGYETHLRRLRIL